METAKEKAIRKRLKDLYGKAEKEAKLVSNKYKKEYYDVDKWFDEEFDSYKRADYNYKIMRLYRKKFNKIHEKEVKEIDNIKKKYDQPIKNLWQQLVKIAEARGEKIISRSL